MVYTRLREALGNWSSIAECRARLLPALDDLSKGIATPGTELDRPRHAGETTLELPYGPAFLRPRR